ncbi:hypothetical protein A1OO_17870 [Enterovibrio norvegicus FF-33]|nr:hypothetical protein A1OO_17870 [Enterovibrio norvegicus FF-33]
MNMEPLISALQATNKPVCMKVADALSTQNQEGTSYDLHLRSADLNLEDVTAIVKAIHAIDESGNAKLRSLSMSYNGNIGDEGMTILAKYLPRSVQEIGLVRCNIGDKGAQALISWMADANALGMLCVEENAFSSAMKIQIKQEGKGRRMMLVV